MQGEAGMESKITKISGYFSEEQAKAIELVFSDGDDDLVTKLLVDFAQNPAFSDEEIVALRMAPYIKRCGKCKCEGSNIGTKTCQKWHPKVPPGEPPLYMGNVTFERCACPRTLWDRLKDAMKSWM